MIGIGGRNSERAQLEDVRKSDIVIGELDRSKNASRNRKKEQT